MKAAIVQLGCRLSSEAGDSYWAIEITGVHDADIYVGFPEGRTLLRMPVSMYPVFLDGRPDHRAARLLLEAVISEDLTAE